MSRIEDVPYVGSPGVTPWISLHSYARLGFMARGWRVNSGGHQIRPPLEFTIQQRRRHTGQSQTGKYRAHLNPVSFLV